VLALYDQAAACSDATALAQLTTELTARAGMGPLWSDGRALFATAAPLAVAGAFNAWSTTAAITAPLCGTGPVIVVTPVATGLSPYKLVDGGGNWSLDPGNPAFAYDDFAGNPDGRNSAIDTPDSGVGHLVSFGQECSTALGNCREVTAYLPPAYDAPASAAVTYPVMFMHDGQNIWDDNTCCFGNGGWQVNLTLDSEIAANKVAPVIVIGAANTANRNNEYGLDPTTTAAFEAFQIDTIQPDALARVRGDGGKVVIGGSSLGGLIAMQGGLARPDVYRGIASLSGAFWPTTFDGTELVDQMPAMGKKPLAIYLDHGGEDSDNGDGAADSDAVVSELVTLGWQETTSPSCAAPGASALCFYWEPGATHDELAWRARVWRMLEFMFPAD